MRRGLLRVPPGSHGSHPKCLTPSRNRLSDLSSADNPDGFAFKRKQLVCLFAAAPCCRTLRINRQMNSTRKGKHHREDMLRTRCRMNTASRADHHLTAIRVGKQLWIQLAIHAS